MKRLLLATYLIVLFSSVTGADETVSLSGRLELRDVEALEKGSAGEDPGLTGRFKIDGQKSPWRIHSWLEGGWDGAVKRPVRDHRLFKDYDRVYQSNSPSLEFKEFYLTHSSGMLDLRAGIQRFAWGRLDEYPPNDLLNPWDYSQFLRKLLEDRKIGVPSVSATLSSGDWTSDAVWAPVLVPYRLSLPDERWSGVPVSSALANVPNAVLLPSEPELPERTIGNGNIGLRIRHAGEPEWALNLYHGYDPKPVFKTTALVIAPGPDRISIDPGYVPDFHRLSSLGFDAASIMGDWSIRLEGAWFSHRYLNIRRELWGYPAVPAPGVFPLHPIAVICDTVEYGAGADYRLFEDGQLTLQAQQTVILDKPDSLYERGVETIFWANLKAGWMNQKVETNLSVAWNPEHGATMTKANARYVLSDAWKAGVAAVDFNGSPQSLFGRFAGNDQVEVEWVRSW